MGGAAHDPGGDKPQPAACVAAFVSAEIETGSNPAGPDGVGAGNSGHSGSCHQKFFRHGFQYAVDQHGLIFRPVKGFTDYLGVLQQLWGIFFGHGLCMQF